MAPVPPAKRRRRRLGTSAFAALAVVVVPQLAPQAAPRVPAAQGPHSTPRRTAPGRTGVRDDGLSANWSGVADTGATYTSVSATWQVPAVVRPPGMTAADRFSSTWVGIGGDLGGDTSLIQAGTEQDLSAGGVASYSAWYELLPGYSMPIDQPVGPGDTISVAITETNVARRAWTIAVADSTQAWTYSRQFTYASSNASAEWIEEAPMVGQAQSTMADFQSVTFSAITVDGLSTLEPAGSTVSRIDYVGAAGTVLSYPEGYDAATNSIALTYGTPGPLALETTALPDARLGAPYAATLVATGGLSPYAWALAGTLPAGLAFDAATGAVTGTPTAAGSVSVFASVTDDAHHTVSAVVPLTVLGATFPLVQGAPDEVAATAGHALRAQLALSALQPSSLTGRVTYATTSKATWELKVSATGVVTVPDTVPPGVVAAHGTMTDPHGDRGTWLLSVHVARPTQLVVVTSSLPPAEVGVPYGTALVAFGPTGTPAWHVAKGTSLPKGLSLSWTGWLSGTPASSTAGSRTLHLRVTDGSLARAVSLALRIAPA